MPLDPTVAEMLQQIAQVGGPTLAEMSPFEARELYRVARADSPKPDVASIQDAEAGDIPVRIYKVSDQGKQPVVVFFHGGGWVIGDLETHDSTCRQLALGADCTVVSVDYRLAPEHPFPAAIDDCYEATQWVANNADSLGIDVNKLAVAGESAGGNLSACVCIKSKHGDGPLICLQLLIYPVIDARMDTESYKANKEGYMLSRESMEWFWQHYTGGNHMDNPLASPISATDLSGLPAACIITAEYDPLRDEGEAYGEALKAAGVATEIVRYDGMIHDFLPMTDILEGSRQAMYLASRQLTRAFNQ